MILSRLAPLLALASAVVATPTVTIAEPSATIIGSDGLSQVEKFNNIPFAQQPTGSLRLRPPRPLDKPLGTVEATGISRSCPQFFFSTDNTEFPGSLVGQLANHPLLQKVVSEGEDCLGLNIRRPAGTTPESKLPVLVWFYGGGFELGSSLMYDGTPLVSSSVDLDMPIIFVGISYRVAGFGFLPGKEVLEDGAANLGLLDQRVGLQWVADNIAAFGGDPDRVTIWGESAGSISVYDQMILFQGDHTYKGKPLFQGGIMSSGGATPAEPMDSKRAQRVYDKVVSVAKCDKAPSSLQCLRELEYDDLLNATNSVPGLLSYYSPALSYLPRPDGKVLTESPERLGKAGKYARVPFIIGDQEDEGTLFALFQSNITTTDDVVDYLSGYLWDEASREQLEELVATYKDITTHGSPFRTGLFNNWYPQFKRLAALLGDVLFNLSRRVLLNNAAEVSPDVPSWSYLSSYNYGTPILGTVHGTDILQVFYGILPNYASRAIHTYFFSFVYDQDPNSRRGDLMEWPQWKDKKQLMQFFNDHAELLTDDYRSDSYEVLVKIGDSLHI